MMLTLATRNWQILIWSNIALTLLLLLFFQISNIDVILQNYLFNFENKTWLISRADSIKKFIFYQFPKIALGLLIAWNLAALTIFKKKNFNQKYRGQLILLFLGITLIPLIAGNIKKFTNIYCPDQLEIYDGSYPYVKIFDQYPANFKQIKKGQCFPAGHAITGFCLMILFFIFENKTRRYLSLIFSIVLGLILGFYQMAKGVHFISDTIIAMTLCFLLATIIAKLFYLKYNSSLKN